MGKEIQPPPSSRQPIQAIYEDTKLPPILPPLQLELLNNNPFHSRAKSQDFTFSQQNEKEPKKNSIERILCTPTNNKPNSISPILRRNDHQTLPSINTVIYNPIKLRDRRTAPAYKLSKTLGSIYHTIRVRFLSFISIYFFLTNNNNLFLKTD